MGVRVYSSMRGIFNAKKDREVCWMIQQRRHLEVKAARGCMANGRAQVADRVERGSKSKEEGVQRGRRRADK